MVAVKAYDAQELERLYNEQYHPLYEEFAARLHALLKFLMKDSGIAVDHIESRVKTVESFMEKLSRKSHADPFRHIKDCAGLRIITYYHDNVPDVVKLIREEFEIDEANSLDKFDELGTEEFGYRSVHLVVALSSSRAALREWKQYAGLPAEIQIRSVLQHAWATISHGLNYKSSAHASRQLLRQLFRLSAQLEQADEEFTTLRDHIIQESPEQQGSEDGAAHAAHALTKENLREMLNQKVDLQKWERFGVRAGMNAFPQLVSKDHATGVQILLLTLQAGGIATLSDFENLLPELETQGAQLRTFVESMKVREDAPHAVPVDVLVLLVSFARANVLPPDFEWGGMYEPVFVETLRRVCQEQPQARANDVAERKAA